MIRLKNILLEQTDKYLGKYMNRFNLYINDEGYKYIRGANTNWMPIDVEDGEGNPLPEREVRKAIYDAMNRESYWEYKKRMRGY